MVKNLGSGDRQTLVRVLVPPFCFQVGLSLKFFRGAIEILNIPMLLRCYGCEMRYGSIAGQFLVGSKCLRNVSYEEIGNSLKMGTVLFILAPPSSSFLVHMRNLNSTLSGIDIRRIFVNEMSIWNKALVPFGLHSIRARPGPVWHV